ncbi:hypothetical protein D3C81_675600 [compost metagenome]
MGIGRETQAMQQLAGAGFGVIRVELGHALVGVGNGLPVFARSGGGFFIEHGSHFVVTAEHVVDGAVRQGRGFLGNVGNADLARQRHIALVGFQLTAHGGEQAGFACTVTAHHAHAVAGMQGEVDIGQQQALAPAKGEITKGNHE